MFVYYFLLLDKFMAQTSAVDDQGRASFDVLFAHRTFFVCRSAHAANMLAGYHINAIMSVQCSAGCHRSNVVARALQQFLNGLWNSDGHKHRNCCARACTTICRMQVFVSVDRTPADAFIQLPDLRMRTVPLFSCRCQTQMAAGVHGSFCSFVFPKI